MPVSPLSLELFTLLLVAPMFVWDLYRLKQFQRAYVIWFVPFTLLSVLVHLLWNSAWWLGFVPKLMGVA